MLLCLVRFGSQKERIAMDQAGRFVADAILGIDTIWGGDVMNASGTGRFIADSWFSGEHLPEAYTRRSADIVRKTGGLSSKQIDREAIEQYLREVDIPAAITGVRFEGEKIGGLRGRYLVGLAQSLEIMWDLAMEVLGKGPAVEYADCVEASTGRGPEQSDPRSKRERLAELLERAGYKG